MMRTFEQLTSRLPLQFRVLYRQFLLRVVDLEALSMEADVPKLLGQFAGVLILITIFQTIGFLYGAGRPHVSPEGVANLALHMEQSFVAGTMLVAGLVAVVSWDATFPDRQDVMALGPLPVKPRTILLAKMAANGALLGVGVVALNFGMSMAVPLVTGGALRFFWFAAAYWVTMAAAAVFVYGSVLTVQGFAALLLPRRMFLRVSAVLQLLAFAVFLAGGIFQPELGSPQGLAHQENAQMLGRWPAFWFVGMLNGMMGRLPRGCGWLATRGWLAVGIAVLGASASLLLCYLRTMKKTVEEPDLMPGAGGLHWTGRLGGGLQTAVVLFSVRSLVRSRQHRVIYAFYLAIVFAITVALLRTVVAGGMHPPLTAGVLMLTMMMMAFAVAGLRSVFPLPVSLKANWVLQVTQLQAAEKYISATRRSLLLLGVAPVWVVSAALMLCCRPLREDLEHMAALALLGTIMADACMIGVSKIPFACSYLPGKSNIQYMFWAFLTVFVPLAMSFSRYEAEALAHPRRYAEIMSGLLALTAALRAFNWWKAKEAVVYYEETEPELITTLGLSGMVMSPAAQDAFRANGDSSTNR